MIKTNNLNVGYEKKILIQNINLTVKAGEILTLIGPNGSGKSTILKTLTRQLSSIGGSIALVGKDMDSMKDIDVAKHMSMVMTNRIKPELMTCREVVETGRYPYTGRLGILSKEDEKKVEESIQLLKIDEIENKSFEKISDGQRQRVMLARAIAQEPEVLILDEPTSYLDMKYKLDILSRIRTLARTKNIAVVMSLHELDLAAKVSDTVVAVDGEKISKTGTPEEIFSGDFIQRLYNVDEKEFDPLTGAVFMKNNTPADVFVICGGGSGLPVFNRLQRAGRSFKAGIIYENDIEFIPARAMAEAIVSEKAFEYISQEKIEEAKKEIDNCKECICTVEHFGPLNEANKLLMEYAKEKGKLK